MENLVIKFYQDDIVGFVLVQDQSFNDSESEYNMEDHIEKILKIQSDVYNECVVKLNYDEKRIRELFLSNQVEVELWEDGAMENESAFQLSGRFLETLKVYNIDQNLNLYEIEVINSRRTNDNVNVMMKKELKIEVYDKDSDLMIVDYFIWSNLDQLKSQVSDFSKKVYAIMQKGRWICDTSILTDEEEGIIYYM